MSSLLKLKRRQDFVPTQDHVTLTDRHFHLTELRTNFSTDLLRSLLLRAAPVLILFIAALLVPIPARAQGCVQCSTSAHASGPQGERALLKGMLILLLPSVTILTGIGITVYRLRHAPGHDPQ